jgi:hypothetical protein
VTADAPGSWTGITFGLAMLEVRPSRSRPGPQSDEPVRPQEEPRFLIGSATSIRIRQPAQKSAGDRWIIVVDDVRVQVGQHVEGA